MALLVVVYKTPKNPAAFDAHYASTHAPLAKRIPGLRSFNISAGPVGLPIDPASIHMVALLEFDSADAIRRALASPEGQAAAADVGLFADGGADMMIFDTKSA